MGFNREVIRPSVPHHRLVSPRKPSYDRTTLAMTIFQERAGLSDPLIHERRHRTLQSYNRSSECSVSEKSHTLKRNHSQLWR